VAVGTGAHDVAVGLAGMDGIEVVMPADAGVASAIGAARAFVAGQIEVFCEHEGRRAEAAVARARRTAVERAIHAGQPGAGPDRRGRADAAVAPALRIRVRAEGPCL
jgi:hypothetical protein